MIPVDVLGLQIEATSGNPLVLLKETDGEGRVLPIFVGGPEALAIAIGLGGATTQRPLTHDLLVDVLAELGTELEQVSVVEVRDGTFFAELLLQGPDGEHRVSSRPSDAIALAIRLGVPVLVSEAVLDEAAATMLEPDDALPALDSAEIDETVDEFRQFLDELEPGDFTDTDPNAD